MKLKVNFALRQYHFCFIIPNVNRLSNEGHFGLWDSSLIYILSCNRVLWYCVYGNVKKKNIPYVVKNIFHTRVCVRML